MVTAFALRQFILIPLLSHENGNRQEKLRINRRDTHHFKSSYLIIMISVFKIASQQCWMFSKSTIVIYLQGIEAHVVGRACMICLIRCCCIRCDCAAAPTFSDDNPRPIFQFRNSELSFVWVFCGPVYLRL